MQAAPRPRRDAPTYRLESPILERIRAGVTFRAIADELAGLGATLRSVRYTAERLRIRRPPGRPRRSAPDLIPSAVPAPARW